MVFHNGRLVRGTWTKKGLSGQLTLATKAGKLTIPAGHTWIELVPAANGNVTFNYAASCRPAARRRRRRGPGSRPG